MNYSDPGELSWVDEGLADLAIFLNGYPAGGSHVAYHQVFHRETSLTRWGGGLENYGASFTWFLYLWEQAGGNGGDGALRARPGLRRRRRRPPDQADLRARRRRHGRDPGGDRRVQRAGSPGLESRSGLPTNSSRTGSLRSTSTTRVRRGSTSRTSTSATRTTPGATRSTSRTTSSGRTADLRRRDADPASSSIATRARAGRVAVRHLVRGLPQPGPDVLADVQRRRHDPDRAAHRNRPTGGRGYESQSDNILNVDARRDLGGDDRLLDAGTSSRRAGTTATSRRSWTASG